MIVLVPGVPALLPGRGGLIDPIPELRTAVHDAVRALVAQSLGPVGLVAAEPTDADLRRGRTLSAAREVGEHLLAEAGATVLPDPSPSIETLLVVANGSARRTERAPGHLDERAEAFDAALGAALGAAPGAVGEVDADALCALDLALADDLWADASRLPALGERLAARPGWRVQVDYDAAPHGVQYWVARYL